MGRVLLNGVDFAPNRVKSAHMKHSIKLVKLIPFQTLVTFLDLSFQEITFFQSSTGFALFMIMFQLALDASANRGYLKFVEFIDILTAYRSKCNRSDCMYKLRF